MAGALPAPIPGSLAAEAAEGWQLALQMRMKVEGDVMYFKGQSCWPRLAGLWKKWISQLELALDFILVWEALIMMLSQFLFHEQHLLGVVMCL